MNEEKRSYNNSNRLVEAEQTKLGIMKAFGRLWTRYSIKDITLTMISEEANVTTRTILRKFGSKEELINESLSFDPAGISADREGAKVGDVDEILKNLLSNYEAIGDAAIRTIHLEPELDIARKIGAKGRILHRDWCTRMFAPYLPERQSTDFEIQLASFIAATEIYLWKLLRKDLNLSKEKTFSVFKNIVEGLIYKNNSNPKS